MINPKTINLNQLPSIPLEARKKLPEISGIYFAIDSQGFIQYIGRSVNIQRRWLNHHRQPNLEQQQGIKIAWLEISDHSLLPEIEKALIEYFKPPLNGYIKRTSPKIKSDLKTGKNLKQIALENNIKYSTFHQRVSKLGWSISEAIAGKRENASYPQKRSSTTYTIKGEEPKGKMLGFRPLESDEKRILAAIEKSGMTKADWLTEAAIAKLDGRVISQDLFEEVQQVASDAEFSIAEAVRQWLARNRHKKK